MHLRYREINSRWFLPALTLFLLALQNPTPALAASASEIDRKVDKALQSLYETTPGAKSLAAEAKGILVFPKTVKLGFIAGGQFGYGALR
ncbi:MAG TPA: twin-arginine translocation pathway signal protein, partial [Candidatus Binatia bacterium]